MSTNNHHDPATDPAYVQEQTGKVITAFMTAEPLEPLLAEAREDTVTRAMGALVTFEGLVRDHDGGQRVATLTYTCHPTADQKIREVCESVIREHPHARVWAAHRTGTIPIGEAAFVVLAASAHRAEAFAACAEIADRVKAEVPIWKEQELIDGPTEWVGLE
ncbi:molybdenum cofactor biosynthesis protein MoaE [Corynebacterium guangdongense]|uniref:Molybdopterin synthase catalytic subunit n=1 Tax=Corynebacterium guangdongense TaxID=1783348 RepID=A0ABU2A0P5_9CORY|nr:molybdenum cofactor biosynthesis protein MoaE [Corynebacterium guangdongense]MDR7330752.1 molybdopterin synthase catalytic subunit [Corynebacterium guangdongense]WJZ16767.1 Molybdopterin synthase catalytic subunit 1 [Corynebacterium guangdongense]